MSKRDILDYFSDINYAYNDSTRLDTLSRMLDELVEQPASPWHRVEEELPKYGQDVLAARLYGADSDGWAYEVIIAHVCEVRGTNYWNATNVTHWMPLPEPPQEENDG